MVPHRSNHQEISFFKYKGTKFGVLGSLFMVEILLRTMNRVYSEPESLLALSKVKRNDGFLMHVNYKDKLLVRPLVRVSLTRYRASTALLSTS